MTIPLQKLITEAGLAKLAWERSFERGAACAVRDFAVFDLDSGPEADVMRRDLESLRLSTISDCR